MRAKIFGNTSIMRLLLIFTVLLAVQGAIVVHEQTQPSQISNNYAEDLAQSTDSSPQLIPSNMIVGAPGVLTKEEYLADPNFLNIDAKLRSQNDLVGYDVVEVRRQLVNGNNYWLTYKNVKEETKAFKVYASFSGDLEIKNDESEGQIAPGLVQTTQTIEQPPAELVPSNMIVGAPGVLTKEEYLADPNFLNIDAKLRKENDLVGYDVIEVRRQLVNGNNYWVTYKNAKEETKAFKVYASFSGDLEVKNDESEGQIAPGLVQTTQTIEQPPAELVQQQMIVGGPKVLTAEEYLADPNFLNIDAKLRKENDLVGYDMVEVRRQLVNGNNYWVAYKNAKGDTKAFKVYASFSGDLEVKNDESEGQIAPGLVQTTQTIEQPPAELVPSNMIVGAPGVLTKEEYLADPNFLNIDAKLRKENDLVGYDVIEVRRQLVNGNNYWVTYKNAKGDTKTFKVYANFSGDLEVKNDESEGQIAPGLVQTTQTIEQPPAELVPSNMIVGAPGVLTKEEYLADPNFLNIDAKLRKENDLVGYDVIEVRRQLVNGNNYWVTYKNAKEETKAFKVYASFSGDLEVKNDESEGQIAPGLVQTTQTIEQPPAELVQQQMIVGGPKVLTAEEYLADPNFLNIDAKLRKENDLVGYDVVEVRRQLVNGNNYWVTYKNAKGDTKTFKVYASFSGDLEVKSDDSAAPQQVQLSQTIAQPPAEAVPSSMVVGAPGLLTKEEYLADHNFLNIDAKLRRQKELAGYDVIEVRRQLVNGNNYWLTYQNARKDIRVFKVYASFRGDLQVQSDEQIQGAPIVDGQATPPTMLTEQQIKKSPGFALSYISLIKNYSFFLQHPKVTSVSLSQDPNDSHINIYDVILKTDNGPFEAILDFNTVTQEPTIKSLVVYTPQNLRRL